MSVAMLPTPPWRLWKATRDTRAFVGNRSIKWRLHYAQEKADPLPVRKITLSMEPGAPRGSRDHIEIPMAIWNLGLVKPEAIAYIEGAMVHAQLLSRQGIAAGQSLADINAAEIASQDDLATTMAGIRSRVWSIALDARTQANILEVILRINAKIVDPIQRASALCDVFSNPSPMEDNSKKLARLPIAVDRMARIAAWVAYIEKRTGPEPDKLADLSSEYVLAIQRITSETMIDLGAPKRQLDLASDIDRGLDLIIVAATARWMRGVVDLVGRNSRCAVAWDWASNAGVNDINSLLRLYGVSEVADPDIIHVNRRCLKAAIDRLTAYKKNLQKRIAKKQNLGEW